MFMAEMSEGIRLVMTQFLLQNLKFGIVEGLYVLAPASGFWLLVAAAIMEMPAMFTQGAWFTIAEYPFHFLVAMSMGVCINFLSYLVIQATSSLTMKVNLSNNCMHCGCGC